MAVLSDDRQSIDGSDMTPAQRDFELSWPCCVLVTASCFIIWPDEDNDGHGIRALKVKSGLPFNDPVRASDPFSLPLTQYWKICSGVFFHPGSPHPRRAYILYIFMRFVVLTDVMSMDLRIDGAHVGKLGKKGLCGGGGCKASATRWQWSRSHCQARPDMTIPCSLPVGYTLDYAYQVKLVAGGLDERVKRRTTESRRSVQHRRGNRKARGSEGKEPRRFFFQRGNYIQNLYRPGMSELEVQICSKGASTT